MKQLKMAALVAGFLLVCSGCTNSPNDETGAANTSLDSLNLTTQTTVAEATPTTDRIQIDTREGEGAMRRYEAYWQAFDAAIGPPFADADYRPLLELGMDSQNKPNIRFITDLQEENRIIRLPTNAIDSHTFSDVENAPVGEHILQFQDCHYTNSYKAAPEEPQRQDADAFTFIYLVELLRENNDSDWHVSAVQYIKTVEGKSPCVKL